VTENDPRLVINRASACSAVIKKNRQLKKTRNEKHWRKGWNLRGKAAGRFYHTLGKEFWGGRTAGTVSVMNRPFVEFLSLKAKEGAVFFPFGKKGRKKKKTKKKKKMHRPAGPPPGWWAVSDGSKGINRLSKGGDGRARNRARERVTIPFLGP